MVSVTLSSFWLRASTKAAVAHNSTTSQQNHLVVSFRSSIAHNMVDTSTPAVTERMTSQSLKDAEEGSPVVTMIAKRLRAAKKRLGKIELIEAKPRDKLNKDQVLPVLLRSQAQPLVKQAPSPASFVIFRAFVAASLVLCCVRAALYSTSHLAYISRIRPETCHCPGRRRPSVARQRRWRLLRSLRDSCLCSR